jgi:cadmium resistance protein CadD (predicted permease)
VAVVVGAALVFAATNLDDFVLLLAFLSDRSYARRAVLGGQYLGIAVLVLVALIGAQAARSLAPHAVGLLGLIPIALGTRRLRRPTSTEPVDRDLPDRVRPRHVGTVALATIGSGGDNVSAYVPYFAVAAPADVAVTLTVFAVMTGLWCATAAVVLSDRRVAVLVARGGQRLVGLVMIGLGLAIIVRSGTLAWLTSAAR